MSKKQHGLWDPRTVPAKSNDYDYLGMVKPDQALLDNIVTIHGVQWKVPCGYIFCEVCEGCIACSDDQCLAGDEHVWPDSWQDLAERLDD